jgi:hypothetical protein
MYSRFAAIIPFALLDSRKRGEYPSRSYSPDADALASRKFQYKIFMAGSINLVGACWCLHWRVRKEEELSDISAIIGRFTRQSVEQV